MKEKLPEGEVVTLEGAMSILKVNRQVPAIWTKLFGKDLMTKFNDVFTSDTLIESDAWILSGNADFKEISQWHSSGDEYPKLLLDIFDLAKEFAAKIEESMDLLVYKLVQSAGLPVTVPKTKNRDKSSLGLGDLLKFSGDMLTAYNTGNVSLTNARMKDFFSIFFERIFLNLRFAIDNERFPSDVHNYLLGTFFPDALKALHGADFGNVFSCLLIDEQFANCKGPFYDTFFQQLNLMASKVNPNQISEENTSLYERVRELSNFREFDAKTVVAEPFSLKFICPGKMQRGQVLCYVEVRLNNTVVRSMPYARLINTLLNGKGFKFTVLSFDQKLILSSTCSMSLSDLNELSPSSERVLKNLIYKNLNTLLESIASNIDDLLIAVYSEEFNESINEIIDELNVEEKNTSEDIVLLDDGESVEDRIDRTILTVRSFHEIPLRKVLPVFRYFGVEKNQQRMGKHPIYVGANGRNFAIPARKSSDCIGSKILLNALKLWEIDEVQFFKVLKNVR